MKNAARTTDLVQIRWRAKGIDGSFRPKLPRRTDCHYSIQIVGQNAESDPCVCTISASQATVSPLVLATAQAYRRFLAAPPPLLTAEPPLTFMCRPSGTESSFIGQANLLDTSVAQERFVVLAVADRDFSETYGDSMERIDQSERFERLSAFVDKYETEVEEHGVDRLRVIDA